MRLAAGDKGVWSSTPCCRRLRGLGAESPVLKDLAFFLLKQLNFRHILAKINAFKMRHRN